MSGRFMLLYALVLLAICSWVDQAKAIEEPALPSNFKDPRLVELRSRNGLCPYLKRGYSKVLAGCWTCGLGHGLSNSTGRYTFDCCPGFKRNNIYNKDSACAFVEPTWRTMVEYLKAADNSETGDWLDDYFKENEDALKKPITLFTTKYSGDMALGEIDFQSKPEALMPKTMVGGRIYSRNLENKMKIPLMSGGDLKITTYSNGLVFLECRTLINPDHETKNGLVHIIDSAFPDTSKNPTVYARLQSMPEAKEFLNDIPSDMQRKLEDASSNDWLTVLAPDSNVWVNLRDKLGKQERDKLWRNHVFNKMICSGAITDAVSAVGPSMSDEYVGMVLTKTGGVFRPQVIDACGTPIWMSQVDLMAGNGVVHQIGNAIAPLGTKNLQDTLNCMASSNLYNVQRAAREFENCGISVSGSDNIVLLPTDEAISKMVSSSAGSLYNSDRCRVLKHHVIKPTNRNAGIGQQTVFDTQAQAQVTSTYVRERDETKLYFNTAKVSSKKPQEFAGGKIYLVSSMAVPPTDSITGVVASQPDTSDTVNKMRQSGIENMLRRKSPNFVFLATKDLGWGSREAEEAFSSRQLESLFLLHTIPQAIFGDEDGFIGRETVMKVDSMLNDRNGRPVKLTIKRYLDGNTFIGHDSLPEAEWSLVIKWNLVANEGNVWIIDWPMKCPSGLC